MSDYRLGPCIVLAAAVRGTRDAYDAAMEMLPMAERIDGRPKSQGGQPFSFREWRSPAQLRADQLLQWARDRAKLGTLPGVQLHAATHGKPLAEILPPGYGKMKTAILEQLTIGPKSAREIATELGNSARGVWGNLKRMEADGRVANDVPVEDGDQDDFVRGPKPMLWRLVEKEAA